MNGNGIEVNKATREMLIKEMDSGVYRNVLALKERYEDWY